MDKNQYIGLVLMFGLLAIYFVYFSPDPAPIVEEQPIEQSQQPATETVPPNTISDLSTQLNESVDTLKYGVFSFAVTSTVEEKIIETDELTVVFSNLGGKIKAVTLNNHLDYLGNPVKIMDGTKSASHLQVQHQGKSINLSEIAFKPSVSNSNDTTTVTYTLSNGNFNVTQTYKIPNSGFEIDYDIKSVGLNNILDPADVALLWNHSVTRAENTLEDARYNCNIRYYQTDGEFDDLAQRSTDFEEETLNNPLKWVSFKQKFFTIGLIANSAFKSGYITTIADVADTTSVKNATIQLAIPYTEFLNGFGY
ncbi:MAG: YidC/Oxa1 family insertase periplasmic-domain containing protein, partial [Cyclobacteriaceae bacterium]